MTDKKTRRKPAQTDQTPRPEGEENSGTNNSVATEAGRPAGETEKTPGTNTVTVSDPFRFAGTSTWSRGGRFVIKGGQRVPAPGN